MTARDHRHPGRNKPPERWVDSGGPYATHAATISYRPVVQRLVHRARTVLAHHGDREL